MHCSYHNIGFNLKELVVGELPYTQAFYREEPKAGQDANDARFYQDVHDYFAFPLKHSQNMPVYHLHQSSCARIETEFETAYAMLVEAVGKLFAQPDDVVMKYMGCDFLRKHPYFLDYARHTFRDQGSSRQSIYGRFDAVLNPETEEIEGIYEFNGDTPTMLFESVMLQNQVCEAVTGDTEQQLNSFWPLLQKLFADMGEIPGAAGVIFDHNSFEDVATCEVLAQVIGENNECLYVDVTDIDYDFTNRSNPFVVGDTPLSVIFALVPWEEMVESFPQAYKDWKNWANHVTFLEPAWRWFISNKGIWAYVTHLFENDAYFKLRYDGVPILPTYLDAGKFLGVGSEYVSKPKIGRMSNNIEIFDQNGQHKFSTDGAYAGDDRIYQMYAAPYQVEGRNNFIIGMFMVPEMATDYITLREATAATLCIREFDSPVLGIRNERFIPHVLIDDLPEDHEDDYLE